MTTLVQQWRRLIRGVRHRVRVLADDRGAFAALELSILVPFVIVMMLLVVGFGRVSRGRQLVDQAAQAAARSASLQLNPAAANAAAQHAAEQTVRGAGLSCSPVRVRLDVSQFHAGGQVIAHLSCRTSLSGLALAGMPGTMTLSAESTSPLETYRQIDGPQP